eukprot:CAMPEP_0117580916 /NCGR_PEP_ID=MMETSP0784-20121206/65503_1 /TAXON_ID=39447 /ORGANISM="" /LENGTH=91 /DNA_ID=CAMNT_0005381101 /DNA_START=442 /DNA_END=717 /DNA_ORIENTATION=+
MFLMAALLELQAKIWCSPIGSRRDLPLLGCKCTVAKFSQATNYRVVRQVTLVLHVPLRGSMPDQLVVRTLRTGESLNGLKVAPTRKSFNSA